MENQARVLAQRMELDLRPVGLDGAQLGRVLHQQRGRIDRVVGHAVAVAVDEAGQFLQAPALLAERLERDQGPVTLVLQGAADLVKDTLEAVSESPPASVGLANDVTSSIRSTSVTPCRASLKRISVFPFADLSSV